MKIVLLSFVFGIMLASIPYAQYGYGTSSVTLSQYTVNVQNGGFLSVNYTVNLVSGNTWGSTINVVNSKQLLSEGISTTLSKTTGNPPFNGNILISISPSSTKGAYQIILNVTGDDPSAGNTTLNLNILAPGETAPTTTTVVPLTNLSQGATTSVNQSSTTQVASRGYVPPLTQDATLLIIGIVAILIIALVLMRPFRGLPTRLDVWGVAFILIGIMVWLYGDYSGGLMQFIWSGVALILFGTIIWLVGDSMAGAFKTRRKS